MNQRKIAAAAVGIAGAAAVAAAFSFDAFANTESIDYRKKVIGIAGIMSNVTVDMDAQVTRGEFAKMLVNASTYKDYLSNVSNVSVYSDVPASHEYASAIRIASEQDWMSGYLGGLFKPEQPITLKESVKGLLALLGYTNEDFQENLSASRMSLFYALEMDDELNREENEVLNRTDCVNLFYNLLATEMKSGGKAYGTVLGCEVDSDGEISPMEMADSKLSGPKVVTKGSQLGNYIPFNVQQANIFVNGDPSNYERLKSYLLDSHIVIYYNQSAKTVWAYIVDEDVQTGRCAVRGTIENIYYSSSGVMTPTSVTLDDDSELEYKLNSSDVQFAFSIYGSLRVGDTVTLICEKTVNSNDDATYVVIDYVED